MHLCLRHQQTVEKLLTLFAAFPFTKVQQAHRGLRDFGIDLSGF